MRVVGLLSGGKDSCYNLCHCATQGHEIIALASLGPPAGKEEIDSYLYQTVGQDALHLVAEAFDLPLYRRHIVGDAIDQSSDYAAAGDARKAGWVAGDETEDLTELLRDVLIAHPDIKGVAVGAILSNYQRVRVEHVCARLGLQSLAYLWQYDQSRLLDDMAYSGMDSIIIKVAGAGLGPRHLGRNVCSESMRKDLEKMKNKWGTHPAGEGGEYETFTLDCPLYKRRIQITTTETIVINKGDERHDMGWVAYLQLKEATLQDKLPRTDHVIPIQPLLDDDAKAMAEAIEHEAVLATHGQFSPSQLQKQSDDQDIPASSHSQSWIGIDTIACPRTSLQDEVRACLQELSDRLELQGATMLDLVHINLYLTNMDDFASVNAVYNTFFGPSPPTRACVSAIIPQGTRLRLDAVAATHSNSGRTALHIRSFSYWAPANIGPYSQAVRFRQRLFVAGQIGLMPSDLTIPHPPSFAIEAALSAQHVRRIVKAMQSNANDGVTRGWMESCVCWISGPASGFGNKLASARKAWRLWQPEQRTPFLIVQVPQLPRGAQIEWQVTWQDGQRASSSVASNLDDDDAPLFPRFAEYREGCDSVTVSLLSGADACAITVDGGLPSFTGRPFSRRAFVADDTQVDAQTIQVLNLATMLKDSAKTASISFFG